MSQSQRDGLAPENYVLGRSESEYDRLRIQSQLFEPITEPACVLRTAPTSVPSRPPLSQLAPIYALAFEDVYATSPILVSAWKRKPA